MANEFVILLSCYHIMCFSPFIESIETKDYVSFSLVGLLGSHFLLCMAAMLYFSIKQTNKDCKRKFYKRKMLSQMKKRKE